MTAAVRAGTAVLQHVTAATQGAGAVRCSRCHFLFLKGQGRGMGGW